jgi:hypothetical protein
MNSDLTERIAARAYQLYEARGRQDGFDLQDWLQAEKEIELLRANDETDASTVEEQTEKYSIAHSRSRS